MGSQKKLPETPCTAEVEVSDQFPAGLRVLMVDDDVTCLKILEQKLRRCLYTVTSCSQATVALNLLREKKGCFDIVLSDVHMPDMDGFKLLELVGLEMDLPVIMMSADGRTSAVMQGIRHGACDYLIKPIREEELKNLWQHVVRKKWNENKEHEPSCSLNDIERPKRGNDDSEYASSYNSEGGEGLSKREKKRRDENEEDCDTENDDPSQPKKPRVVWSVELHQQFVSAVNHLGIDKAVPKRILELMNVPGLTRENVASHLQKFRLYLKRLSQHQGGISGPYCGPIEQNAKLGSFNGFDMHTLVTSGQIPPQTLAALQAELLGRPTGSLSLSGLDHSLPGSFQGSNTSKQFQQNILATGVEPNNFGALAGQNSNVFMGMLHNQQQQKQLLVPESSHSINVQPSCLVVPSLSSPNSCPVKDPASVNQNFIFDRNCTVNYDILAYQQSSSSFGGSNTRSVLSGYSVPLSITSSASCGSMNPNSGNIQDSMSTRVNQSFDQGSLKSLGFVGKRSSIPSRFAIDEAELSINKLNYVQAHMDNRGRKVKQELSLGFMERERVGIPVFQNYSTSDLTSVNSE